MRHYDRQTNRQTDRQTDRQTEPSIKNYRNKRLYIARLTSIPSTNAKNNFHEDRKI